MNERDRLLAATESLRHQMVVPMQPWRMHRGAGNVEITDRDGLPIGIVWASGPEVVRLAVAKAVLYAPADMNLTHRLLRDGIAPTGILNGPLARWRSEYLPPRPWGVRQINDSDYRVSDAEGTIFAAFDSLDAQRHASAVLMASHYVPRILDVLSPRVARP